MRGGTANCSVKIADEEIGSPYIDEPDVLVVFNEPSYVKFYDKLKSLRALEEKRDDVLRLIDEQGALTDELREKIEAEEARAIEKENAINIKLDGEITRAQNEEV